MYLVVVLKKKAADLQKLSDGIDVNIEELY